MGKIGGKERKEAKLLGKGGRKQNWRRKMEEGCNNRERKERKGAVMEVRREETKLMKEMEGSKTV